MLFSLSVLLAAAGACEQFNCTNDGSARFGRIFKRQAELDEYSITTVSHNLDFKDFIQFSQS